MLPPAHDVSGADLQMAMERGRHVLAEAWSDVRPTVSLKEVIGFRALSAAAVLGPEGFGVDNRHPPARSPTSV